MDDSQVEHSSRTLRTHHEDRAWSQIRRDNLVTNSAFIPRHRSIVVEAALVSWDLGSFSVQMQIEGDATHVLNIRDKQHLVLASVPFRA